MDQTTQPPQRPEETVEYHLRGMIGDLGLQLSAARAGNAVLRGKLDRSRARVEELETAALSARADGKA